MDPDENLKEQKKLANEMIRERSVGGVTCFDDVARLCDLVVALDEWMSKGGFPPKAWKQTKA